MSEAGFYLIEATGAGSEAMRLKLRALSRFRPRVLTLVVFAAAAAVIALANLSFDEGAAGNIQHRSYGWPLIWHRIVLSGHWMAGNLRVVGWYFSLPRLAANVAMWLALLAALAALCEWLLRRYRPRPRWGLRTLLAFVAVVAAVCGWYAHARNRAAIQDPLVPERGIYGVPLVFVDRWRPKWLDILGMDRLRRRIVVASGWSLDSHEPATEQRFLQLARAPELRHLVEFHVDELSATTATALGGMRQLETLKIYLKRLTPDLPAALSELTQLRKLSISWGRIATKSEPADDNDARLVDECLAAIGNITRLQTLELRGLPLRGKGLACLAGAKELKSLDVDFWNGDWKGSWLEAPVAEDSLRAIGTLDRLEWLRLNHLNVRNESLAYLAGLTKLKTLSFSSLNTQDHPAFSHLPSLPRLEALELELWHIEEDDLRRLAAMPRLKSLSFGISYGIPMAALASLDSLEEVQIQSGNDWPEQIEALLAVQHLKRLHLSNLGYPVPAAIVTLDDGTKLYIDEDDLDGFQHALKAPRQSKPGLVIGSKSPRSRSMIRKHTSTPTPSKARLRRRFCFLEQWVRPKAVVAALAARLISPGQRPGWRLRCDRGHPERVRPIGVETPFGVALPNQIGWRVSVTPFQGYLHLCYLAPRHWPLAAANDAERKCIGAVCF